MKQRRPFLTMLLVLGFMTSKASDITPMSNEVSIEVLFIELEHDILEIRTAYRMRRVPLFKELKSLERR